MSRRSESFISRRSTLTLIILAFILGAVYLTVKLAQVSQEIRQRAQAAVSVTLTPDRTPINIGDEVNIALNMDTGTTQIAGVDLRVTFDSAIFDGVSFTQSTGDGYFDAPPFLAGAISGNVARISLKNEDVTPKTGAGSLASLKLRAKAASSGSVISFVSGQSYVLQVGNVYINPNYGSATVVVNGSGSNQTTPDSTITVLPSSITVGLNDTVTLPVHINTGANQISSATVYINYDQAILEGLSITNGGFLGTTVNSSISGGIAAISVSIPSGTKQGEGVLAVLTFKGKAVGSSNVVVNDSQTSVTALGVNGDAQRYSLSSTVTVTGSATASPTPGTGGVCYLTRPASPSNVNAVTLNSSQVLLSWSGVSNSTYYGVVYGEKSGNYIYGASNVGNVTSYTVKNLKAGKRYYFAVFAVNDCAPGDYSYEVSAVPTSTYVAPTPDVVYVYAPTPTPSPYVYVAPSPTSSTGGFGGVIASPTIEPFLFPSPIASPVPATGALEGVKLFFYNFLWVIIAILVLLIIIMVLYKNTRRD